MAKGRVLEDTHTGDVWEGASKRMKGQTVRENERKPGNARHVSLGRDLFVKHRNKRLLP